MKRLLSHYSTLVRRKLAYYNEFITDIEVKQNVEDLLDDLRSLEGGLLEEVQQMINAND